MKRRCLYLILLWMALLMPVGECWGTPFFPTRLLHNSVAGLNVSVAGSSSWRPFPYYIPSMGESLVIEFDILGGELLPMHYTLKHQSARWEESELASSEYIRGFTSGEINDSQLSEATKVAYRHYTLRLDASAPSQPILSGNYLLQIYPAHGSAETPYLEVAFALLEPLAELHSEVAFVTSKDSYATTQQVDLSLKTDQLRVTNPTQELILAVGQNSRHDNAVFLSIPSHISNHHYQYRYAQGALFAAGNEYYAYEILNDQLTGMGIECITTEGDNTQLHLYPQSNRAHLSYLSNQDADGRYVIRSVGVGGDSNINTDYYEVYFCYYSPPLPSDQEVYLFGEAFDSLPLEERRLSFNPQLGAYEGRLLLKGGYVSFTYLSSADRQHFSTTYTEGNFYTTSNSYSSFVYYRPQGERYDRLVAVDTIRANN